MSDDPIKVLSVIASIATHAIARERERRESGGPSHREHTERLLLHLTCIKRLARGALPENEQALLAPEENSELVKTLAQSIRDAADERSERTATSTVTD